MIQRLFFEMFYFRHPPWDTGISPPELIAFTASVAPNTPEISIVEKLLPLYLFNCRLVPPISQSDPFQWIDFTLLPTVKPRPVVKSVNTLPLYKASRFWLPPISHTVPFPAIAWMFAVTVIADASPALKFEKLEPL